MKYIFLGGIALILGLGTALASLTTEDVFVRAVLIEGGEWVCYNTNVTCHSAGVGICSVIVPLRSGATVTSSSSCTPFTYKAGCAFVKLAGTDEYYIAPLTGDERPMMIQ